MKAIQDQVPFDLIAAFAESILQGNKIYCNMSNAKKLQDINFSVPDAIRAVGKYLRGLNEWVGCRQPRTSEVICLTDSYNLHH